MNNKAANTPEGEMAAAKRTLTPWDADSTTVGSPTSLDLLLTWLLTPGNYQRFHSRKKNEAVQDIIAALKDRGGHHRTESSIRGKVRKLEAQYLSAKTWLKEMNIHDQDVVDDNVAKAEVRAICPNYFELRPVFQDAGFLNATAPTQTNAANRGQGEGADSSDLVEKRARSKLKRRDTTTVTESPRHPSKRRQPTSSAVAVHSESVEEDQLTAPGVLRQTTTYRKIQRKQLDLSGSQHWCQRSDERSVVVRDLGAPLPRELQRQVHEVKVQHAKMSSHAVLEHEDKLRTKMMECDVEFKRDREEVQLVLEKVLARQKMKGHGVTEQELDAVLPVKKP